MGGRMVQKYILDDCQVINKTAGSKARIDINYFLEDYETIYFCNNVNNESVELLEIVSKINFLFSQVEEEDIILVQFPLYLRKPFDKIDFLKPMNGKKIAIVHDINSLRYSLFNKRYEIDRLNQFHTIIAHNKHMKKWMQENGVIVPIVNLDLFDYNSDDFDVVNRTYPEDKRFTICIAGNLEKNKAGYIYNFKNNLNYNINLYGVNYCQNTDINNSLVYKGSYSANELPSKIEGHFGLVWDGPSTNTCSGDFGDYLKYNNPHKVSLYVRSKLPIIIWKEAALAEFVIEHEIGFVIDSLDEIIKGLNHVSRDEYERYIRNIEILSEKVKNGYFTKSVVSCIESSFC
jgi:hypothetical protein